MGMRSRLASIQGRMATAAESVGRDPASITLVAVSKTFPAEAVREAYDLGVRDFGESRLQEALPKIEALPEDIRWHFIGTLQSNKARKAASCFSLIHTLENEGQLKEISKAAKPIGAFIEVNVGEEAQKSGISLDSASTFRELVVQYPLVHLRGLMAIGPANRNAEDMRPFFRAVADANRRIKCDELSLGMSGDFEVAIQEGSTHVRIGSALFGSR